MRNLFERAYGWLLCRMIGKRPVVANVMTSGIKAPEGGVSGGLVMNVTVCDLG